MEELIKDSPASEWLGELRCYKAIWPGVKNKGEMPQWDRPEVDMPGIRGRFLNRTTETKSPGGSTEADSWRYDFLKRTEEVSAGSKIWWGSSPEPQRWAERTPPCPVYSGWEPRLTNIAVISLKAACGVRTAKDIASSSGASWFRPEQTESFLWGLQPAGAGPPCWPEGFKPRAGVS